MSFDMSTNAKIRRSCKCGNVNFLSATNREAAFRIVNNEISSSYCSKCGSKEIYALTPLDFNIDEDILEEWSLNEALLFDEYGYDDYEISNFFLPIDIILKLIDSNYTLNIKKGILISTLFIKLNNAFKKNDKVEVNDLLAAIKKRRKLVDEYFSFISPNNKIELLSLTD